jgi:hypothetical protein
MPGAPFSRNASRWFIAKSEGIYGCLPELVSVANQFHGSASFIGMLYAPYKRVVSVRAPSSTFALYRSAKHGVRLMQSSALYQAAVSSHAASVARTDGMLVPLARMLARMQARMHTELSHRHSHARTHAHTCSLARLLACSHTHVRMSCCTRSHVPFLVHVCRQRSH